VLQTIGRCCRGVVVINSNGNSELARIYLRLAWRNSSRSKYNRPASILIRSGGLRASEKFLRRNRAWVAASETNRCKTWSVIYSHILVSFVTFLSTKYAHEQYRCSIQLKLSRRHRAFYKRAIYKGIVS